VQVIADRPDHDLAGAEPDAGLGRDAVPGSRLVGVRADRLLHCQRRVAGPDGVVLVRDGGAEHRHQPIAHQPADRSLVPVDGVHHQASHTVEERLCLFRIAALDQLRRSNDVGEQDRDLLPLACEGGTTREDLLGQVARRVGAGRALNHWLDGASYRLGALHAEFRSVRQLGTAVRTASRERRTALHAEPGSGRVLGATAGAPHRCTSLSSGGSKTQ